MKIVKYEDFHKIAEQLFVLCPNYRFIIREMLYRMEKEHVPPLQSHFKENFRKLKTDRAITYEELARLLTGNFGLRVDVNTLKSYNRKDRKSLTSCYSKEIAEIFEVSEEQLIYGRDYLTILSQSSCDIKNMFLSLSQENQEAVYYLVSTLYKEKLAPEFFENEHFED